MRLVLTVIGFLFIMVGCNMENRSGCNYAVSVVDKTGLDGCTIMFERADGTLIEPVQWAVEKPALKAGEDYFINYEDVDMASICMAGETVKITCITKVK